jgi:hypothetical protein
MNILKLQDELKSVPDQALVGYVQNPSGQVPTYLALSELQRRKDMRAKYQQAKPEKSTVAQDLSAPAPQAMPEPQVQPQAGVAALPTGDMFQEQNYATGGIVAFGDGGSILDKARNYLLPPSPTTMRSLQGQSSNPFISGMPSAETDPTVILYQLKALNEKPNKTYDDWNQIKMLEQQIKGGDQRGGYAPEVAPAKTANQVIAEKLLSNKPAMGEEGAGITSILPKAMTLDEAIQREKDAYTKMGVDPEFYSKQTKKLDEEREALKGEKSQAGWMALAKAGLGMAAGKSPYALQNIATGAMQGIEQYGIDTKDLKKEQNLLRASDQKLAEAQYLQSRGDAQGALKAMDEREKLLVSAQQHKDTINATIKAAQISAGARSGAAQLPALYNALTKAEGNPALQKQIQDRIDEIELGAGGGAGIIPSGVTVTKNK